MQRLRAMVRSQVRGEASMRKPRSFSKALEKNVLGEILCQRSLSHHAATEKDDVPRVAFDEPSPGGAEIAAFQKPAQGELGSEGVHRLH